MTGLFARPAAALSSGLLARKGQARPAMRSQNLVGFSTGAALDDLGWNDMGGSFRHEASVMQPEPAPVPEPAPQLGEVPAVLVAREALRQAVVEPAPLPPSASPMPRAMPDGRSKAAFTLRLDAERHLRLRLASATANRSAQALLTDALDALLAGMPEVETLASHLPDPVGTAEEDR